MVVRWSIGWSVKTNGTVLMLLWPLKVLDASHLSDDTYYTYDTDDTDDTPKLE